jgi:hypothetical protein
MDLLTFSAVAGGESPAFQKSQRRKWVKKKLPRVKKHKTVLWYAYGSFGIGFPVPGSRKTAMKYARKVFGKNAKVERY